MKCGTILKQHYNKSSERSHIPHKTTITKDAGHPWITIETKRLIKKIGRLYNKDDWKTALVYKKGQKYNPENYHPISLMCICCKLLEHILVVKHIMKHEDNHNLLYPLQHGFRRGRSCKPQLLDFIDDIPFCMENGKQTVILVMDFCKHSIKFHILF